MDDEEKLLVGMLARNFSREDAAAFLRFDCRFEGDELYKRLAKYLDVYHQREEVVLARQKRNVQFKICTLYCNLE